MVYAKAPFRNPGALFRYLGLYTHGVAISNRRLVRRSGRFGALHAIITVNLATSILDFVPAAGAMPAVMDTSVPWSCAVPFDTTTMRFRSASPGNSHASHRLPTPRITFAPRLLARSPILFVHAGDSGLASRTRGLAQHAV